MIAEAETRFLDPADDLVSVCSEPIRQVVPEALPITVSSSEPSVLPPNPFNLQAGLPGLATAVAVAVLIPILTFSVIPGFVGRMTVVLLVALGTVGALYQSGVVGRHTLSRDLITCSAIYGGVMVVIAGIMA